MDPDPDQGGPKTCGSGGSGSATLEPILAVFPIIPHTQPPVLLVPYVPKPTRALMNR